MRTTTLSRVSMIELQPCVQFGQIARRAVELPRARLVQEILREQRAHRAQIDDVRRPTRA